MILRLRWALSMARITSQVALAGLQIGGHQRISKGSIDGCALNTNHGDCWIDFCSHYRQSGLSSGNEEFEMTSLVRSFLNDEQGQDLIEYTLLLAFVCLASAALFISAGGSVSGIWSATNSQLAVANTSAS